MDILKGYFGSEAHWQINKKLTKEVGLQASLLLTDLFTKSIYFANREELDEEGFFFNTRDNIKADTTLSFDYQRSSIKKLVKLGFLQTKEQGLPLKTYYKVLYIQLLDFFTTSSGKIQRQVGAKSNANNNKYNNNKITTSSDLPVATSKEIKVSKNSTNNKLTSGNQEKILTIFKIFEKNDIQIPKIFFKNKTQREASLELFNDKGEKKVDNILSYCQKSLSELDEKERKYFPNFSNPYNLLKNYESIKIKS